MRVFALGVLALCAGCGRPPLGHVQAPDRAATRAVSCDSSAPPPSATFRLSIREYRNTLSDLFSDHAALNGLPEAVSMELAQLPPDGEAGTSFSGMDRRTSQRHVDSYLKVADGIGRAIAESDERLSALAGSRALAQTVDAGCFRRFLAKFGKRVFRRPLIDSEASRLSELERDKPARATYRRAITELLSAPQFLFHLEQNSVASPRHPGWYELTPYEL